MAENAPESMMTRAGQRTRDMLLSGDEDPADTDEGGPVAGSGVGGTGGGVGGGVGGGLGGAGGGVDGTLLFIPPRGQLE
jgi:hypothetical protein